MSWSHIQSSGDVNLVNQCEVFWVIAEVSYSPLLFSHQQTL